jgi:hypothetical protein
VGTKRGNEARGSVEKKQGDAYFSSLAVIEGEIAVVKCPLTLATQRPGEIIVGVLHLKKIQRRVRQTEKQCPILRAYLYPL